MATLKDVATALTNYGNKNVGGATTGILNNATPTPNPTTPITYSNLATTQTYSPTLGDLANTLQQRKDTLLAQEAANKQAASKLATPVAPALPTAPTAPKIVSSSTPVVNQENDLRNSIGSISSDASLASLKTASDNYIKSVDDQIKQLEANYSGDVARINQNFESAKTGTEEAQKREAGAYDVTLQRIGGYLGPSASAQGAALNLAQQHRDEILSLYQKREDAIRAARQAVDEKSMKLAQLKAEEIKSLESEIYNRKNKFIDDMFKANQEARAEKQFQLTEAKTLFDMQNNAADLMASDVYDTISQLKTDKERQDYIKQFAEIQDIDPAILAGAVSKIKLAKAKENADMAFKLQQLEQDNYWKSKDYALEQYKAEQGKYSITTDAFGNAVAFDTRTGTFKYPSGTLPSGESGLKAPELKAYNDAITKANIGLSKDQQENTKKLINQELTDGDFNRAKETLIISAAQSLGVDQRSQIIGRVQAINAANDIKSELNDYVEKTGDTSILIGTLENAVNKIGLTSNERLAGLKTKIAILNQTYRRSMTGVAFGEKEAQEYVGILSNINNVNTLNVAKMNSFIDVMNKNQRAVIGFKIGDTNYDEIFGRNTKAANLSELYVDNPGLRSTIQKIKTENPNLSDDEVMQIVQSQQ